MGPGACRKRKIRGLRKEFPSLGKAKLTVLLKQEGFTTSSPTVRRILGDLKTRGLFKDGEQPEKVSVAKSAIGNQKPAS